MLKAEALQNAIKYHQVHGHVTVQCTLAQPEAMRISVRDTGCGLVPDKLAQLFQPFNRLGQEQGTEEGTGIGLVVAQCNFLGYTGTGWRCYRTDARQTGAIKPASG